MNCTPVEMAMPYIHYSSCVFPAGNAAGTSSELGQYFATCVMQSSAWGMLFIAIAIMFAAWQLQRGGRHLMEKSSENLRFGMEKSSENLRFGMENSSEKLRLGCDQLGQHFANGSSRLGVGLGTGSLGAGFLQLFSRRDG